MSYRFYDAAPVFYDKMGLKPLAGGKLLFCALGTTTPKNTFSDAKLSVLNENPVPLDSSGRSNTNIWLDGEYTVTLYSADGTTVWTRDVIGENDARMALPPFKSGMFLSNNGEASFWTKLLQIPDPSDAAHSILSNDGKNPLWIPQQAIPALDVVVGASSLQLGISSNPTKFYLQRGSSAAPGSGSRNTKTSVTFPKPFKELWQIVVTQVHDGVTANGAIPSQSHTTQSNSGFSVRFSTEENSDWSGWNIISQVYFDWLAVGLIEVGP